MVFYNTITNVAFSWQELQYLQVLSVDNARFGYNAARNQYEDLIDARILDPSKVILTSIVK